MDREKFHRVDLRPLTFVGEIPTRCDVGAPFSTLTGAIRGLQGLRTGWLICQDKDMVTDAIILREKNSSEILNVMGKVIAEIALRPERLSKSLVNAIRDSMATLEYLDKYITSGPKLFWHRPEVGLIGLARLSTGIDGDLFAKRLLADPYKTFLLPGSAYRLSNHIM